MRRASHHRLANIGDSEINAITKLPMTHVAVTSMATNALCSFCDSIKRPFPAVTACPAFFSGAQTSPEHPDCKSDDGHTEDN